MTTTQRTSHNTHTITIYNTQAPGGPHIRPSHPPPRSRGLSARRARSTRGPWAGSGRAGRRGARAAVELSDAAHRGAAARARVRERGAPDPGHLCARGGWCVVSFDVFWFHMMGVPRVAMCVLWYMLSAVMCAVPNIVLIAAAGSVAGWGVAAVRSFLLVNCDVCSGA